MTATSAHIILDDGRTLGFAEYGAPQGWPIMYFHGWPSSRLEARMVEPAAHKCHVRIIAPDRPGFGGSTFKPGRKLADWPADVIALANALALDHFAIMGVSGGGPYAAICALKIPQRIRAAGIISGMGPADAPGVIDDMRRLNRLLLHIGRNAPWLVRIFAWQAVRAMKRNPDRFFTRSLADLPQPDQAILSQAEYRTYLLTAALEAFRSGTRGAAQENALLYAKSWDFQLEDIAKEVYLWHGELDRNVPPAMGRYVAAAIPHCRSRFYRDEGHLSVLVNHIDEIMHTLRAPNGF